MPRTGQRQAPVVLRPVQQWHGCAWPDSCHQRVPAVSRQDKTRSVQEPSIHGKLLNGKLVETGWFFAAHSSRRSISISSAWPAMPWERTLRARVYRDSGLFRLLWDASTCNTRTNTAVSGSASSPHFKNLPVATLLESCHEAIVPCMLTWPPGIVFL